MPDLSRIAQDLQLRKTQVETAVRLLDAGDSPSFIARYRKEKSGGLDEDRLRMIQARVAEVRQLADRKATIIKTVESHGKMTDDLRAAIHAAETNKRLDDLFLPFKPKKRTAASDAREKGLEELAKAIWTRDPAVANLPEILAGMVNPEKGLNTPDDVMAGVKLILTETIAETADVRAPVRFALWDTGRVVSKKAEPRPEKGEKAAPPPAAAPAPVPEAAPAPVVEMPPPPPVVETPPPTTETPPTPASDSPPPPEPAPSEVKTETPPAPVPPTPAPKPKREDRRDDKRGEEYKDYYEFTEALKVIPPHRILAVNRGEREHALSVKLDWDADRVKHAAHSNLKFDDHPHKDLLDPLVDAALTGYVLPALEKEIRKELTEESLSHAVEIFARNFKSLLLTPPLRNRKVLAIDPGTKTGTKAVALDEKGVLLEDMTLHPLPPQNKATEAKAALAGLIRKHNLSVIAIGNGSSCREIEELVSAMLAEMEEGKDGQPPLPGLSYVIANEAGAADYSDSPSAREEFPALDRMTRGTISIGRRLQDPLAELVKIDPQHVGVGLYQHDIKPKHLKESIDDVIESCVNEVGVDLNTASAALLRYVSGLNAAVAQEVVQHRAANGPYRTRGQLQTVPGFNEARFSQASGFLKIAGGDEPLDATWLHPEQYALARQLLAEAGFIPADLRDAERLPKIKTKLAEIDAADAGTRFGTTAEAVTEIVAGLGEPFADPRDARTPPVLKKRMLRLEDLKSGQELKGTVVNVVPFGAFVDIGLKDTGLVHISRMANKFIKNPYEVVGVGDVVTVWVVEVDHDRKRASLTMVSPGQERKPQPRPAFTAPAPRPPRPPQDRQPGDRPPQDRQPRPGHDRPHGPRPDGPPRRDSRDQGPGQGGRPPFRGQRPQGPRPQSPRQDDRRPAHANDGPPTPPPPPRPPAKPKALPKLSGDALTGKAPLFSFGELEAFFKQKDQPAEPPKPETPPTE